MKSDATFRLLISPTPLVGPDDAYKIDNHVNHNGFRHEGRAFFQWVVDNKLHENGFFTVCGDRHWQYHSADPLGVEEFSCGALCDENFRVLLQARRSQVDRPERRGQAVLHSEEAVRRLPANHRRTWFGRWHRRGKLRSLMSTARCCTKRLMFTDLQKLSPHQNGRLRSSPRAASGDRIWFHKITLSVVVPSPVRFMHIRCPHCRNPLEIVDDRTLDDVNCPSCGSSFGIVDPAATATWQPLQEEGSPQTQSIGHFELNEQLGMGAFGAVWKAWGHGTRPNRRSQGAAAGAVDCRRNGEVSQAEPQLKHPNLVPVHEVGREGSTVYIVSDFIDGSTLTFWLSVHHPSHREVATLWVTIADALHHAQSRV